MTTTTYYDLNIVEGTDIVNPLTVDNPNYEKIDETMHNNAVSGVTLATEIANATVHAITRENSECAVIRFIATSNWKAGDTVTVDGVPVTALLPSGETLPDGAYVINANVLCILTGTNLTVYAERKKIDNASEIRYNNTNVKDELNKINKDLENDVYFSYALNTNDTLYRAASGKYNLTYVNLSDRKSDVNKNVFFAKPADDSEWEGYPPEMKGTLFLGVRQIFLRNTVYPYHCLNIVYEAFPIQGRIWTNFYNVDTWTGWNSVTPKRGE